MIYNNSTWVVPREQRIFVSSFYAFISFSGICLHALVFVGITRVPQFQPNRPNNNLSGSNFFNLSPFNFLVLHLQICEMLHYLLYLLYASPCVAASTQIYGSFVSSILDHFESVDFIAITLSTFLVSIDRSIMIGHGNLLASKIFTLKNCAILSILCWVVGCVIVALDSVVYSSDTVFLEKEFYFAIVNNDQLPQSTLTSFCIYVAVYGVVFFYGYAFLKIYKMRKRVGARLENDEMQARMAKHEQRMFYQAMCIWVSLLLNVIAFRTIPIFLSDLAAVLVTAVVVLGQNSVTPLCMIIFSEDVRAETRKILLTPWEYCSCLHQSPSPLIAVNQIARMPHSAPKKEEHVSVVQQIQNGEGQVKLELHTV